MIQRCVRNEKAIKYRFYECTKKENYCLNLLTLVRNKATFRRKKHHLERKARHCYPRGKTWLRMLELNLRIKG